MRRLALFASFIFAATYAGAEPIHLIAPSSGDTLRGGRFATLSWTADRLGPDAEEWEAFLSVDGGRFFAVRLTPHLDIAIRKFDVLIPNVDSDDVRILLRTGDERNETIIPMPQRFRIRAEAIPLQPAQTREAGPESARPNEPPVVEWSAGGRVLASAPPDQVSATNVTSSQPDEITVVASRVRAGFMLSDRLKPVPHTSPPPLHRSRNLLLVTTRINV